MPSLRGMQVGIPTLDIEDPPLADLLIDLGAIIVFDGTLTDDETPKLKNLGSGGSALDATITDLTINENGMVFNGTSSLISVPNHSSLNALTDFCYLFWCKPNVSAGEGSNPRLWSWGNSAHTGYHSEATGALNVSVDYASTDGFVTTANSFVAYGAEQMLFMQHRASDKLSRIYKGINGAVAEATYSGTPTAGTGSIVARPDALNIGNTLNGANTFADYMKTIAIFGRELLSSEMLSATLRSGLI